MAQTPLRPFYHDFAWAYDYIIDAPVAERCDFIEQVILRERPQGSKRLLDAGCGPGQYSADLARRGFDVIGLDWSDTFVQQAQRTYGDAEAAKGRLRFLRGNILYLPELASLDVVLCRGVLNDLLGPVERQRVFQSFGRALQPGGLLLFDVREWATTAERITQAPEHVKTVATDRGMLTFRSTTVLNRPVHQMLIHEQHLLQSSTGEIERTYDFVMQCWTREEVLEGLQVAHFDVIQEWGAYDDQVGPGTTDRMVICARYRS